MLLAVATWSLLSLSIGVAANNGVTNLSSLAPCAATAINDAFGQLPSRCGDETVQKCICADGAVMRDLEETVLSQVMHNCETKSTHERRIVSKVIQQYCTPSATTITSVAALTAPSRILARSGPTQTDSSEIDGIKYDKTGRTSAKVSPGVIAGIVVGVVVGTALVVAALVLFVLRKRRSRNYAWSEAGSETDNEMDAEGGKPRVPGGSQSSQSDGRAYAGPQHNQGEEYELESRPTPR